LAGSRFCMMSPSNNTNSRSDHTWSVPRYAQPVCAQKRVNVSTLRGHRFVGAIGSGRTGSGATTTSDSALHRGQDGFYVKSGNGFGSAERLRLA
jgi:hypothetical protein